MKIEFTDAQLELLREVLAEYAEICYQEMFEYKHVALEAEEQFIRDQYNSMAAGEEERFGRVKALGEYIEKYEALMRNV